MKQLVIEVTDLQADKLKRICPHGTKKPLFHAIIESIFDLYSKQGRSVITALITQQDPTLQELLLNKTLNDKMTKDLLSTVSELRTLVFKEKKYLTTYSEVLNELALIFIALKKENLNGK